MQCSCDLDTAICKNLLLQMCNFILVYLHAKSFHISNIQANYVHKCCLFDGLNRGPIKIQCQIEICIYRKTTSL